MEKRTIERVNSSIMVIFRCNDTFYSGTEDLELMNIIDKQYMKTPFYGSRSMTKYLKREGHAVNRKRIQRLMRLMG